MGRLLFTSRWHDQGSALGSPEFKNPERELFLFRRRLSIAGVLAALAFGGLLGRFFYLQVVEHRHYQTLAETNRIAIVPIIPNRGVIRDRNGLVLAQSYSAYTLEIQPSRVRSLDETIASVSASFSRSRRISKACRFARASRTTRSRALRSIGIAFRASRSRRGSSVSTRMRRSPRT